MENSPYFSSLFSGSSLLACALPSPGQCARCMALAKDARIGRCVVPLWQTLAELSFQVADAEIDAGLFPGTPDRECCTEHGSKGAA
ncbi:hypothetical protein UB46_02675 [Burkholderiaceae bacterium 16]|nr:hypothetical protein UB46_02675 [Burkholderiaceae bacterium 16]